MSDDLVTWLRAQLDEDERVARTASPGPWSPNAEHDEVLAVDDERVADGFALSGNQLRATVDHIVLHNPARVLREVDAKRQIIERCVRALADEGIPGEDMQGGPAEDVLSLLALPYADRPGYREEWRPA